MVECSLCLSVFCSWQSPAQLRRTAAALRLAAGVPILHSEPVTIDVAKLRPQEAEQEEKRHDREPLANGCSGAEAGVVQDGHGEDEDGADGTEDDADRTHPAPVLTRLSLVGEPGLKPEVGQAHEEGQEGPKKMGPHQHWLLEVPKNSDAESWDEAQKQAGHVHLAILSKIPDLLKPQHHNPYHQKGAQVDDLSKDTALWVVGATSADIWKFYS